jgi:hypothetical protein
MSIQRTAAHEAAHAVGAYLMGIPLDNVEVWHGEGRVKVNKAVSRPSSDPFAHAVMMLAAGEYMRMVGADANDDTDFVGATFLIAMQFDDRPKAAREAAGREAFGIVLEATHSLVRSDRFRILVARLAPILAEKHWNYGPSVIRFLEENDPDRPPRRSVSHAPRRQLEAHRWPPTAPVSRILHDDGTVTLYSYGRLIVSRASTYEVDRLAREIL